MDPSSNIDAFTSYSVLVYALSSAPSSMFMTLGKPVSSKRYFIPEFPLEDLVIWPPLVQRR
uniref:Ovule protein n=1 Tax=Heterorhabditis bacteriophora TaxID=37862 RepID=A0A1I7X2G9_HETBA